MPFPRASGILLHPTCFPGRFGIGDLGAAAYQFIDFLTESGQQLWQILPLGPTGMGNSPYLSYSAMAANPLLINLDYLQEQGLLTEADLANIPDFPMDQVDFDQVRDFKMPLLQKSATVFTTEATPEQQEKFQEFCSQQAYWLDDYSFFMALKDAHQGAGWHTWEPEISRRHPQALAEWKERLSQEIFFHQYLQFQFFQQWSALKTYANDHGIQIFGDLPIYVAHDSADVWAHPEIFALDAETGEPALMAGVPPDYFSATGQLWGNPVYKWERLAQEDFHWWVQRLQAMLNYVDLIRIDHFRGLQAFWAVPQGETVAINGEWLEGPGEAFFRVINDKLGQLPIIAEDLGIITPDVEALRDQFNLPGMKILHFAFDSGSDNPYLPYNYTTPNWIVYTGTHDNNTTVGWFNARTPEEQQRIIRYLGVTSDQGIHWDLIRLASASVAYRAIFPLQDILGLGEEAKMNQPSTAEGNWGWRYRPEMLTDAVAQQLRTVTEIYGRLPETQN